MRLFLFLGLSLPLCMPLGAQSTLRVRADIPFSFEVADRVIPAGSYSFSSSRGQTGSTLIQSTAPGTVEAVYVLSMPGSLKFDETMPVSVVFNRYADRHFLARLVIADQRRDVLKSKSEKALVTSRMVSSLPPAEVRIVASFH